MGTNTVWWCGGGKWTLDARGECHACEVCGVLCVRSNSTPSSTRTKLGLIAWGMRARVREGEGTDRPSP